MWILCKIFTVIVYICNRLKHKINVRIYNFSLQSKSSHVFAYGSLIEWSHAVLWTNTVSRRHRHRSDVVRRRHRGNIVRRRRTARSRWRCTTSTSASLHAYAKRNGDAHWDESGDADADGDLGHWKAAACITQVVVVSRVRSIVAGDWVDHGSFCNRTRLQIALVVVWLALQCFRLFGLKL